MSVYDRRNKREELIYQMGRFDGLGQAGFIVREGKMGDFRDEDIEETASYIDEVQSGMTPAFIALREELEALDPTDYPEQKAGN